MANSIYEKIINKGKLDAEEILREAKEKAEALENAIIAEASKTRDELITKNILQNQEKLKAKRTDFERSAKQQSLFKKKELINKVIIDAKNRLKQLSDDELFNLVKQYILKEDIEGTEELRVSRSEYSRYLSIFSSAKPAEVVVLDKLNKVLGAKYNIKLSNNPALIDGGFILIGKNFDIDLSYASILNDLKEKFETKIANILFSEEK